MYYILEDKKPVSTEDITVWGKYMESSDRVVEKTDVKTDVEVSTVFLGLDHGYGDKSKPVLFETMVFGGKFDGEMVRYCSWDEAEIGHKSMCDRVNDQDKPLDIKISYDGDYPNLCSGKLKVSIRGKEYVFPSHCLSSGGSVSFDDNWNENVTQGNWSVSDWPKDFPEEMKLNVLEKINDKIQLGCCGGCV